jgi:chromosome segregation ATPase
MIATAGIWIFKRGSDAASYTIRIDNQARQLQVLANTVAATDRKIDALAAELRADDWSLRKFRQDISDLTRRLKAQEEDVTKKLTSQSEEILKVKQEAGKTVTVNGRDISLAVKEAIDLAEAAADLYERYKEDNSQEHTKTQGQIVLLAKQIRAIIAHLNDSMKRSTAVVQKEAGISTIMKGLG